MSRSRRQTMWRIGGWWISFILLLGCDRSPTNQTQPSRLEMIEVDKYLGPVTYLTFAESLEQVRAHQRATKEAMTNSRPDDAHAAMHALVNLIPSLTTSAQNSQLSPEMQQRVQAAADILSAAVGKLDAAMHSDSEPVTYEDVADDIDRGMRMLQAIESDLPKG